MSEVGSTSGEQNEKQWRVLSAIDRRVAGALVEKAKTTPTAYPMTLNALKNACNQKSNRYPMMQLEEEDVAESLDRLRGMGAVREVHGDGRVPKYRHLLYEWLGAEKAELAVMTELLLRGAQTVGELRGRAARMEPISDLSALRPILGALRDKGLLIFLTPEGRGCVVTHTLYNDQEMKKLRAQYGGGADPSPEVSAAPPAHTSSPPQARSEAITSVSPSSDDAQELRKQIEELRAETREIRNEFSESLDDLRRDLDDIKQQLGI